MSWDHFPLAADDLITVEQYEELRSQAMILLLMFDDQEALYEDDYEFPYHKSYMVFGETTPGAGPHIGIIREMIKLYMLQYGNTTEGIWRGYYFWVGGEMVEMTYQELLEECGCDHLTTGMAARDWEVGVEYGVDDVVWFGMVAEHRAICVQAHTGAAGEYMPANVDTDYWRVYHPIGEIEELNAAKDMMDYIADNGWVWKPGTTTGTAADPKYNQTARANLNYSWYASRVECTGDAQAVWDLSRAGAFDLWPHPEAPKMTAFTRYLTSPVRWEITGAPFQNHRREFDVGRMINSSVWNLDLKSAGCSYKMLFAAHNPQTPPYAIGVMETDILFDGVKAGTINANGFNGPEVMVDVLMDFDYADWDFTGDGKVDVRFDDENWANFLVPSDVTLSPATWTEPTDYYVDDQVENSMPAGEFWYCKQDHTSSSATEPGTPGGDAYWGLLSDAGWGTVRSSGYITRYTWSVQKIAGVFIKPDWTYYY